MDNLVIDDVIINAYLQGEDLNQFKSSNYYDFFYEGHKSEELTLTIPDSEYIERASRLTQGVKELLLNFNIHNDTLVDQFFTDLNDWSKGIKIALIVGLPMHYMRLLKHND